MIRTRDTDMQQNDMQPAMLDFAVSNKADRYPIFSAVSTQLGFSQAIIEKDFWVCLVLDRMFHGSPFRNGIAFKGGTSLSKCWNTIQRFSEDIDIILDWGILGYEDEDVMDARSKTQQAKFSEAMNADAAEYIGTKMLRELQRTLKGTIPPEAITVDENDTQVIRIAYPKCTDLREDEVILDYIKLEIGPMAAWSPTTTAAISPYVAEAFPKIGDMSTIVRTVMPARTFWEKAIILHKIANKPLTKSLPPRYARHYYDLYELAHTTIKEQAIADIPLLLDSVDFNTRFYRTAWSHVEEAVPGTMRLVPPSGRIPEIEDDYKRMLDRKMIYGDAPSMEEIVECLRELEGEINA